MPSIDIEDIKRVVVRPDEVLLVTVPDHTPRAMFAQIRDAFEANLSCRVLVTTSGIQAAVISAEQAEQVDG